MTGSVRQFGRLRSILVCALILTVLFQFAVTPSDGLRYSKGTNLKNVDASFIGEDHDDTAGNSVRSVGDLNGDGYDDFVIGANGDCDAGYLTGQIYVIFGKAAGWSMDTDLSNADASYLGDNSDEQVGTYIAGIGDLNGDGYDDLAVGVPYNSEAGHFAGQLYLIFGRPSGWAMDTKLDNANASILGAEKDVEFGGTVSGIGDVSGDGFDDMLVAARNSSSLSNQGVVYLLLGSDSGWKMDMDISVFSASFLGEAKDDFLTTSSGPVGDVNGDGYDDIMVMTPNNDEGGNGAGKAYIFFGKADGWKMGVEVSKSDASFIGEAAGDAIGTAGMGTGDVNGDGLDDFILGAYNNGEVATSAGKAYVMFGKKTGWSRNVRLWNADASFRGETKNDVAGKSVAGAGDVNGDDLNDILVGAPGNKSSTGRVYLLLGKTSGWSKNTSLSTADLTFVGENSYDSAGNYNGLSGGGDPNGDGLDDIIVGAYANDEGGNSAGQAYLIFPDLASKPDPITSVKLYSDKGCTNQIATAKMGDVIYVELMGTDTNASRADTAVVDVAGPSPSPTGLRLDLRETGLNTGKFRGNFTIKEASDDARRWVMAPESKQLIISSAQDKTKNATLDLDIGIILKPNHDNQHAVEDQPFKQHYWARYGTVSAWTFGTNATWLKWNATTHNISGTSLNKDVGSYWVRINITDGLGGYDEHNFTLTVSNVPAKILTANDVTAPEDSLYSVDYASDDDPSTTWSIKTNSTWLTMVPATGVLSGTPDNSKVGSYWVNVTCDDGHGGRPYSNFTVVVSNIPPVFGNPDVTTATEDIPYSVDYGTDDDPNVVYSLKTNSSFLTINAGTGVLSGTPDNSNVGSWYVNVTAKDNHGAKAYRNFTLGVTNVPPSLTTGDIIAATEDVFYQNDYASTDDPTTTWAVATDADFLAMNSATGVLNGTPDNSDIGAHYVNVTVRDGHGGKASSNFTLTVTNTLPLIDTADILTATEDSEYRVDYNSSDDLDGGVAITWSLKSNASWLTLNATTGLLMGTPDNSHVGWYWVNVSVDDGNGGRAHSNFTLTVANRPPVILTTDVLSVVEDSEYFVNYACDDDGQGSMTWALDTLAPWLRIDPSTGILNGTPDNSMVGEFDVKVSVTDDHGGTSSTTFKLTVANAPPEILTTPPTGVYEDHEYLVDFNSSDDGQGILYWDLEKGPGFLAVAHETGILKGTPSNDDVGQHQVAVTVNDGNSGTARLEYTLTVLNVDDPPIWTVVPKDVKINKGTTYTFDVDVVDVDKGTGSKFGISSVPASSIKIDNGTGVITWTPDEYGAFKVTISYGNAKFTIYHDFTIVVNEPPSVILKAPANGSVISVLNPTFQWDVSDNDDTNVVSDLYFAEDRSLVSSMASAACIVKGLNTTFFTPNDTLQKGKTYYWTVVASDGLATGTTAGGVWNFTVKEDAIVNHPPTITSTPPLTAEVGIEWRYQTTAVDPDLDAVTVRIVQGPEGMVMIAGILSWTPTKAQVGPNKVKLEASDGKGGTYQEFTVTVKGLIVQNHPPVINPITRIVVKEGDEVRFTIVATDEDGDTVALSIVSGPTGAVLDSSGAFHWRTGKGDAGEHKVEVKASDGTNWTTATFVIEVRGKGGLDMMFGWLVPALLLVVGFIVALAVAFVLRRRSQSVPKGLPKDRSRDQGPAKGPSRPQTRSKVRKTGEGVKGTPVRAIRKAKGPVTGPRTPPAGPKDQDYKVVEAVDIDDLEEVKASKSTKRS